jgi:flagellar motor switch protein FliN/FliY
MANENIDEVVARENYPEEFQRILNVRVEVSGRLGCCRMRMKEVLDLDVGTIVQLQQSAKEPIELCLNDKVVAKGEVVVVNDSFGIKITEMVE